MTNILNPFDLVVIKPNIIPEKDIKEILEWSNSSDTSFATYGSGDIEGKDLNVRNTIWHPIPQEKIEGLAHNIFFCYKTLLEPIYQTSFKNMEAPQFLEYPIGGHYSTHNDSETLIDGKWERTSPRDISIIFYLNDDYEGGQLEFTLLGLTIKPSTGMMIAFPSYKEFAHKVHPVTSGTRYSIVSWLETEKRIYEII